LGTFDTAERDRVREHVLGMGERDERVVSAAVVGSLAFDDGDRWSDLDLSFGVAEGSAPVGILADWSQEIVSEFQAVHLFDLTVATTVYRVFLMSGGLQLDISFTPAAEFHPTSPRFRLLFGTAGEESPSVPPGEGDLLGWAVMYARFARVCIERGRLWQAEWSIAELRFNTMSLSCLRRGLPARQGRGFHQLPDTDSARFTATLVASLELQELWRALRAAVEILSEEIRVSPEAAPNLEARLREAVAE
jgi:hypothetical protein